MPEMVDLLITVGIEGWTFGRNAADITDIDATILTHGSDAPGSGEPIADNERT